MFVDIHGKAKGVLFFFLFFFSYHADINSLVVALFELFLFFFLLFHAIHAGWMAPPEETGCVDVRMRVILIIWDLSREEME